MWFDISDGSLDLLVLFCHRSAVLQQDQVRKVIELERISLQKLIIQERIYWVEECIDILPLLVECH